MPDSPTSLQSDARSKARPADSTDIFCALRKIGLRARCRRRFYRDSITLLSTHFDSPYATISADLLTGAVNETADHGTASCSQWHDACLTAMIDAQYRDVAAANIFESSTLKKNFAVLSAPLHSDGDTIGAITIVTTCRDKPDAGRKLTELSYLVQILETLALLVADRQSSARQTTPKINSEAISKAAEFTNEQELAFSITNGLKSSLQIDHVALATVSGARLRLLSMSGFDDIRARNPGVRLVQQAMEECLDARSPVIYQTSKMLDGSGANLLHKEWHRQTGNSAVASIPLFTNYECVAIVSLRNRPSRPFDKDDLQKVALAVEPYLPGLVLLERANRGIVQTAVDRGKQFAESTFGVNKSARALIAAAIVGLMSWLLVASAPFKFTVPCEIAPQQVLFFGAPFSGTIVASNARQGDVVKEGQILAEFDTRDLLAERNKLSAEFTIANTRLNAALVGKNETAAAAADGEMKIAKAKIALVDLQLEKAVIRAPHDGVIVQGDTRDRIGQVVPLGEPLFAIGRGSDLFIRLEIPENCVQYASEGQAGVFVTNARTDEQHPFLLRRVPLTSSVGDGKTVYLAEASIDTNAKSLRVGMTGYAKITGSRQPLWWIGTRKLIDALRIRVWRL